MQIDFFSKYIGCDFDMYGNMYDIMVILPHANVF